MSTRECILDAAEVCFAEHGFSGVTMRSIAAATGLKNQASLYHHFRDKRALYEAVLARGLIPVIELVRESGQLAASQKDAAAQQRTVETVLDRLLDYLLEHPHLPQLIQRAGLDDRRHLDNVMRQVLTPLYAAGLSALADTGGLWELEDLPHVALGIYHLIFGYFANGPFLEQLLRTDPRSTEWVRRQRRFVKVAVARLIGINVAVERGSM